MISIRLPLPPSTNALYANNKRGKGKGRYKTDEYKAWIVQADMRFTMQKRSLLPLSPIRPPFVICIRIPRYAEMDASNAIKAAEDWLVSREIVGGDDRLTVDIRCVRDRAVVGDECIVEVSTEKAEAAA
jgi:hypothetical protein